MGQAVHGEVVVQRWCVADLMTRDVVTVTPTTGYQRIADLLVSRRISAVPVIGPDRQVLGVVSEADLMERLEYADRIPRHPLAARRLPAGGRGVPGDTAADLMTSPAVTIAPTATVSKAARLMSAARVKRLPVVDPDVGLVGIVSRHDLLHLYTRSDEELRQSVIHSLEALSVSPDRMTVQVIGGVVTLHGQVARRSTANTLIGVVESTPGVINVIDQVDFQVDDLATLGAGGPRPRGHG